LRGRVRASKVPYRELSILRLVRYTWPWHPRALREFSWTCLAENWCRRSSEHDFSPFWGPLGNWKPPSGPSVGFVAVQNSMRGGQAGGGGVRGSLSEPRLTAAAQQKPPADTSTGQSQRRRRCKQHAVVLGCQDNWTLDDCQNQSELARKVEFRQRGDRKGFSSEYIRSTRPGSSEHRGHPHPHQPIFGRSGRSTP
jgi:hypothetical protein